MFGIVDLRSEFRDFAAQRLRFFIQGLVLRFQVGYLRVPLFYFLCSRTQIRLRFLQIGGNLGKVVGQVTQRFFVILLFGVEIFLQGDVYFFLVVQIGVHLDHL